MSVCVFQQLIMQKAAEELKKQQQREMEEKRKAIEQRVPKLEIDGLDKRMMMIITITSCARGRHNMPPPPAS